MDGLMMDVQLTVSSIASRAEALYAHKEIVGRLPDGGVHRSTYGDVLRRAKALALALARLGVAPGDRVATLAWNSSRHLEAYFGIPGAGAVIHTLNPRLGAEELAHIAAHGGARTVLVDEALLPVLETFAGETGIEHVLVLETDVEERIAGIDVSGFEWPQPDERSAAAMCYTSGTTGGPKGVLYSHRALYLHALAAQAPNAFDIGERDVVLSVVPMFHANAWGLPFAAALAGAVQVYPGPRLDAESVLDLLAGERVTVSGGVPTVWLGVLHALDAEPRRWDLGALRHLVVGGSAAPPSLIEQFDRSHGVTILHAWGMTEMSPIGTLAHVTSELTDAPEDVRFRFRARQGQPWALAEIRARSDQGLVAWDGETMGELEVRGPTVASSYYLAPQAADRFTEDGWFRTGDVVTIGPNGWVEIHDREKDLIKSGGEWISSVALENALMGHPAVAEAAVVAVAHPRWQERPLAAVVLRQGVHATPDELLDHLAAHFPRWQLPDQIAFVDEIPKTAAGKFQKRTLRDRFKHAYRG